MARVTLLYFASLRDAAGCDSERVEHAAGDLRGLYRDARARHGFALPPGLAGSLAGFVPRVAFEGGDAETLRGLLSGAESSRTTTTGPRAY